MLWAKTGLSRRLSRTEVIEPTMLQKSLIRRLYLISYSSCLLPSRRRSASDGFTTAPATAYIPTTG